MRRALKYFVMVFCVLALVAPDVADAAQKKKKKSLKPRTSQSRMVSKKQAPPARGGTEDPRYAALIMNPATGEVYHAANADMRRYPASLTKMMTLYLLFEALEKKKIRLNTDMDVSAYAASMPQTNLHLSAGDEIPVEVAIKALVVRSANDVSVVIAEELGGDVDAFARQMTAKARALGMRNTVFKNPNGLPNTGQVTTARDMAKLGIALKRDFPKYYPYFATRQFSWNGATYYTHNRVMLRYAGTDGIKTGYVRASGFNLVTSVRRGGRPLVGVVLGGGSGRWRDDRMIQLLDQTYRKIAERGAARGKKYNSNLPASADGKAAAGNEAALDEEALDLDLTLPPTLEEDALPQTEGEEEADLSAPIQVIIDTKKEAPQSYIRVVPTPKPAAPLPAPKVPSGPQVTIPSYQPVPGSAPHAAPNTSPFAAASAAASADNVWGIQVGAFSSHELAVKSITQAVQLAKTPLANGAIEIMGPDATSPAPVHRARVTHLPVDQARAACEILIAHHTPCFIFKAR